MTHEYKAALETVEAYIKYESNNMNVPSTLNAQLATIRKALELAIALQPKPISEYQGCRTVLISDEDEWCIASRVNGRWLHPMVNTFSTEEIYGTPTHFYDISALPKPEVTE